MRPVLKVRIAVSNKLHPGFMHQRRRLERISRGLPSHLLSRDTLKFRVNERKQPLRRLLCAVPDFAQDLCDFRHDFDAQAHIRYDVHINGVLGDILFGSGGPSIFYGEFGENIIEVFATDTAGNISEPAVLFLFIP